MDYPIEHFISYTRRVFDELDRRDYNVHSKAFADHFSKPFIDSVLFDDLFSGWHTGKYLTQCLANLEEKHDRGGIPDAEWNRILSHVSTMRRRE